MYSYWITVLLLLGLYLLLRNKEHLTVAFNNKEIDATSPRTLYERETKEIKEILHHKINKEDYPRDFVTFYMMDIIFERSVFADYIKKKIQMVFDEMFIGTILENTKVINNMYNVYTKDDKYKDIKYIILYVDGINVKLGFTRKFLVYMKLNNLSDYIGETGEIYPILNSIYDHLEVLYVKTIELDKEMNVNYFQGDILRGKDDNFNQLYEIKNSMEYIEPKFSEMNITSEQKESYNRMLEEKGKNFTFTGMCYGYEGVDNKFECIKNMGIWDNEVKEDSECPYYKANINYPNAFGKIKNGVCELPVNMKNVGYRGYSKGIKDMPLCYNCKYNKIGVGSLGYCCDDQLSKVDIYKNLSSPDYAYVGDKVERKKWESLFLEKSLGVE
jgi:hypothetical protein